MSEAAGIEIRIGGRAITRRFGAVVANDHVDLAVPPASIHAVVGGNGAGKTTLMRILQGVDRPDEGSVILSDVETRLKHPRDAYAHGVGMVHQEFTLAPPLTLLENLILAREPTRFGGLIDRVAARAEAERLAQIAGVAIDWDMRAADAAVHVRQLLEILRLLYRGADVLILDEPTAVLAPAQVTELISLMKRLKAEGRTILFVSHKLDEVMAVADEITVMRGGRVVATTTPAKTSKRELAHLLVGAPLEETRLEAKSSSRGGPLLATRGVAARDRRGAPRLGPVDIEVRQGEIVGVAAVAGNGESELVACLAGLLAPDAGQIRLSGVDLAGASAAAFRAAGIGYVSADRGEEGLCLPASIRDNFIAGREAQPPFARRGWLDATAIEKRALDALQAFSVRYGRLRGAARGLSGGNQQRLVMARELDRSPRLLIAAQPTRGVDIAGIAFIHSRLAAFRDGGGAVLLISEELDELLALSDRIVCLYRGVIVGELSRGEATISRVGRLMLGEKAA